MYQAAVYQTGRLMEWCRVSKGVGRWGRGGKRGSRVTNWAQMSMTISCTWAGQSTDQTTLGITRSVCMSVVYDYTDGGMERTWKGCPDVSEWQPAPCRRSSRSTTFAFCVISGSCCATDTSSNSRWSSVLCCGGKNLNSLPSEVTSSVTLSTFKQKLKTYLFSLTFPGT